MTLRIDRVFGGRRVQLVTGTDDPKLRKLLSGMLDGLYERNRPWFDAVTREPAAKRIPILDVWALYSVGSLPAQPMSPEVSLNLTVQWEAWAHGALNAYGKPVSAKYRATLMLSLKYHQECGARIVADLPKSLAEHKRRHATAHPRTVNMTRSATLGFARDLFGKASQLYRDVQAVTPLKLKPRNVAKALPIEIFRERASKLPEVYRQMAWDLASTGMGWKEYTEDGWTMLKHGIHIRGEKREGRDRIVPLVRPVVGAQPQQHSAFQHTLKKVDLTPYQCRRSYIRWLADIGLPTYWQDYYAGHAPLRQTGLYQESEPTTKELVAHGKLLKAHIGEDAKVFSIARQA